MLLLLVAIYLGQLREGFQAGRDWVDSTRSCWWFCVYQCRGLRVYVAWSLAVHHRTNGIPFTSYWL